VAVHHDVLAAVAHLAGRLPTSRREASRQATNRKHHFRPAFLARVEMLVRIGRIAQRQMVRDDERRLGFAQGDQIAQLAVYRL